MIANVFGEDWVAVDGPVVRVQVRRARILKLLLLLKFSDVLMRKWDRRVLDPTTCLVLVGWYGTQTFVENAVWVLERLGKTERERLRSLEFHAGDVFPRFEHLEVQSIIILERWRLASGIKTATDTNGFELFDLFLEVSVLRMVLLVFSTCGDALGQLHFGLGYWGGFLGV